MNDLTELSLGVWGKCPVEPGALDRVKNKVDVAKRIACDKWTKGETVRIGRADVLSLGAVK